MTMALKLQTNNADVKLFQTWDQNMLLLNIKNNLCNHIKPEVYWHDVKLRKTDFMIVFIYVIM